MSVTSWHASNEPAPHCDQELVHSPSYPLGLCEGWKKKTFCLLDCRSLAGSVQSVLQRALGLLRLCAQHRAAQTAAWVHPAALGHPCSQASHGQAIECMYVYFCFEKPDRKYACPVYRDSSTEKIMGKHNECFCCWFPFVSSLLKSLCTLVLGCFSQHTWHTGTCQSGKFL